MKITSKLLAALIAVSSAATAAPLPNAEPEPMAPVVYTKANKWEVCNGPACKREAAPEAELDEVEDSGDYGVIYTKAKKWQVCNGPQC